MLHVDFSERTGEYEIKRDGVVIAKGVIDPRRQHDQLRKLLQVLAKAKQVPDSYKTQ